MQHDIDKLYAAAEALGVVVMPMPPVGRYYREVPFDGVKYGKNKSEAIRKETKDFTKFYVGVWEELAKKRVLSPPEVYLLTMMFPYCEYNTNYLVNDDVPMDIEDIAVVVNREARQVKRIVTGLTKKNLIAKVESGDKFKYAVNPELYWRGGDMVKYKGFITMFYTKQQELKKNIPNAKGELRVNGRTTTILRGGDVIAT